jgi:hypothetical protein
MNMSLLEAAMTLPDVDLLARIPVLANGERAATAQLVAHLAALRLRPSLYAAHGCGSLFVYCRQALHLSEDAAANRIHAARACLKFPAILDGLASGELSLSAVRMLRPHLTVENHERVLGRARNARRVDVQRLVAELAPRPDVPSSVRKLPAPRTDFPATTAVIPVSMQAALPGEQTASLQLASANRQASIEDSDAARNVSSAAAEPIASSNIEVSRHEQGSLPRAPSVHRPVVQPLSPERYRVQFTMGQDAYDLLRRVQTLLRRDIPDGDTGAIFERALRLLHREVEAAKFGRRPQRPPAGTGPYGKPRDTERAKPAATVIKPGPRRAYEKRIRPGADPGPASGPTDPNSRRVAL